jgi:AAA domain
MTVDLSKITKGPVDSAVRALIYSADGTGKTTFSAGSPDPLFLDANKGSLTLNVRRVLIESWDEATEWLSAIESGQVKCETVVIDSISDLEMMLHTQLFVGTTIDEYKGGYKRGDTYALTYWRNLLMQLERIWLKGKNVVLVGHMQIRRFEAPDGPGYERYEISVRPQVAGLLRQWVAYVLFASIDVAFQPVSKGSDKVKAVTTHLRHIYTRRSPAFDAKSRGTTLFPEKLPLSWDEFEKAIKTDAQRAQELRKEIDVMLLELGDTALAKAMNEWIGQRVDRLAEARNRVASKIAEKREKEQQTNSAVKQEQPQLTAAAG